MTASIQNNCKLKLSLFVCFFICWFALFLFLVDTRNIIVTVVGDVAVIVDPVIGRSRDEGDTLVEDTCLHLAHLSASRAWRMARAWERRVGGGICDECLSSTPTRKLSAATPTLTHPSALAPNHSHACVGSIIFSFHISWNLAAHSRSHAEIPRPPTQTIEPSSASIHPPPSLPYISNINIVHRHTTYPERYVDRILTHHASNPAHSFAGNAHFQSFVGCKRAVKCIDHSPACNYHHEWSWNVKAIKSTRH